MASHAHTHIHMQRRKSILLRVGFSDLLLGKLDVAIIILLLKEVHVLVTTAMGEERLLYNCCQLTFVDFSCGESLYMGYQC